MSTEKISDIIAKVLTHEASESEQQMLDQWLNESKKNQQYFDHLKILWENSAEQYNSLQFNESLAQENIEQTIYARNQKSRKRKIQLWSAAASVIMLMGLLLGSQFYNSTDYVVYSSDDELKSVVLADSSVVWLNKNSTLQVSKEFPQYREVSLQGKAFFDVQHDPSAPFQVQANKTKIEVLGTSFMIDNSVKNENTTVVVETGKVAFYKTFSLRKKTYLTTGQRGVFQVSDNNIQVDRPDNRNYLSWKTKVIEFNDTPINAVCEVLSNHFNQHVKTSIKDSSLVITGEFEDENLEDILDILAISLDIKVKNKENEIIIYK